MNIERVARLLRDMARLGLALADELDPPRKVPRKPNVRPTQDDRKRARALLDRARVER